MKKLLIIFILFIPFGFTTEKLFNTTYTIHLYCDANSLALHSDLSDNIYLIESTINQLADLIEIEHNFIVNKQVTKINGLDDSDYLGTYLPDLNSYFLNVKDSYSGKTRKRHRNIRILINKFDVKPLYNAWEEYITIDQYDKSKAAIYIHEIAHKIIEDYGHLHQPGNPLEMKHIEIDNKYFSCNLKFKNYCRNLMCHNVHAIWSGLPFALEEQIKAINNIEEEYTNCYNTINHIYPTYQLSFYDESLDDCDRMQNFKLDLNNSQGISNQRLIADINKGRKLLRQNNIIPTYLREQDEKKSH